ncbi:VTT domain-containing protein [Hymenobacter sp. ASUV-10]|uniref:VTT domain-containing protein n=1 Tax=Hymenobacter aranciens TaxID=3063996 RepID=A0ABT9B914_9BACT|nr:VTT domain-containing protein [Hymenobacter sp. ASUV-10]MDO7874761.1 VTT domain-containing protein [Hymenobacter sp. ASUV-10]
MKTLLIQVILLSAGVLLTFLLLPGLEATALRLLKAGAGRPGWYAAVSFAVLASDILLPVPSSIVMFLNGATLGIAGGALLSLAAGLMGSALGYGLGAGSARLTRRTAQAAATGAAGRLMRRHGPVLLVATRGIPMLAESLSLLAGHYRVGFWRSLLLSGLGYLPLSILYAVCGAQARSPDQFLPAFGLSLLLSGACFLLGRYFLRPRLASQP